jgi:hypothetical protein
MRRKISLIVIAALAACVMTAGTARSQDQSDAPDAPHSRFGNPTSIARVYQSYIYGVVKKADKNDVILEKTKFGGDQDFKIDKHTKFIRDGKTSRAVILKPGDMVWIDMKRDKKTSDLIAKKIVMGIGAGGGPNSQ